MCPHGEHCTRLCNVRLANDSFSHALVTSSQMLLLLTQVPEESGSSSDEEDEEEEEGENGAKKDTEVDSQQQADVPQVGK